MNLHEHSRKLMACGAPLQHLAGVQLLLPLPTGLSASQNSVSALPDGPDGRGKGPSPPKGFGGHTKRFFIPSERVFTTWVVCGVYIAPKTGWV